MKQIVIVGVGRVGGALARGLSAAGWAVTVAPQSKAGLRRAKALRLKVARSLTDADVCVLAVPDHAIGTIDVPEGPAVVHCAGALELTALNALRRGSFHPLLAISSPNDKLEGGWVAVSASDAALERTLKQMAKALGMHAFAVPERDRARYHAAAVLSAGLAMSLLDAAVTASRLPRKAAEAALMRLTRSALDGAGKRGLRPSMTGPIVRGDVGVVARHLEALAGPERELYRMLSQRMLEAVSPRLGASVASRLGAVLAKLADT